MNSLLICNARLPDREGLFDLRLEGQQIAAIDTAGSRNDEAVERLDAHGGLAVPPFVEPHCHLDYALTAGEPRWNASGTLFEAIDIWAERKRELSVEDVKHRARTAIEWQIAQGIQYVRTHVDIGDPQLRSLDALLALRDEFARFIDIQIVAFPQDGILTYAEGPTQLERAMERGADAVGGIPHVEFTREDAVASLEIVFDLAERYGRMIDIHCDEIDDDQARNLEVVAALAYRRGLGARVTASHTCALSSYNNAYANKLMGLLVKSGINFVANPFVNTHLQGRYDSHPVRRGLTRVRELRDAGLAVAFGHDNLADPFYPLVHTNVLQILQMGLHVTHLTGYDDIAGALAFVTDNGAAVMQLGNEYGLAEGKPARLNILAADSVYDAVRRVAPVRYAIRDAGMIAETQPATSTIFLDHEKPIDFSF
ncbi:Cytosine deaminase protein [Salinisphaera shabanensis E1L3A]|jgi:cytosine deaminase|uniref:Cytosine deaminase protein n=1 Tax=Salinisphaera shabanensis E1L3A TaxID=1033802 RepID=U2EB19_9GAMM|nr:cytosine deaminase [Salinisphaera shabanensis]ERJ20846.1 Cytosine deaminase protein [Salinisphaera shabanensis E1L3A]